MRFTDVFMTIPVLFLILLVVAAYGASLANTIAVLGAVYWPGVARLVRGQMLTLRARDFVVAAKALGAGDARVMSRHLLPNAAGVIAVQVTLSVATAILAESALSFLGLGVPPPTPSWGNMLTEGRLHIVGAWWIATFPGFAILVSVLAFNLTGDGIRDALDPRFRDALRILGILNHERRTIGMTSSRSSVITSCVLGMGVLAAALAPSLVRAQETPTRGGQISMALETDPATLNPILFRGGTEYDLDWILFDSLVELGPDLHPRPLLATSWTVSPDGLTYTFKLKPNVKWHDGRPFTAEDVAFTFYAHLNPKVNSTLRSTLGALQGFDELTNKDNPADPKSLRKPPIEVVDPLTIRFNLRNPERRVPRDTDQSAGGDRAQAPPRGQGRQHRGVQPAARRHGPVQVRRVAEG